MMRPLTIAALALTTAAFASPALAEDTLAQNAAPVATPATAPATAGELQGNVEMGRQLTYTCEGCHGVIGYENAYPSYRVPKIGGQTEPYLVNALNAYQQGTRQHPTMQAQAQSFSAQDIADIAAFLSSLSE